MSNTPVSDRVVPGHRQEWIDAIEGMIGYVRVINVANGWFDEKRSIEADIALLHSEVSEAFEAVRKGNWSGDKDSFQDEIADVFIRLLDTCDRFNVNLTKQFCDKMKLNETRGYKHGGKLL